MKVGPFGVASGGDVTDEDLAACASGDREKLRAM